MATQTTIGWWLEQAKANELRLTQELDSVRSEIQEFHKELTSADDNAAKARKLDPDLAFKADTMAKRALGSSFSIRKGPDRISGKITRCRFAGFSVTRTGRSYKALWEVTVTSPEGGSLTGLFDKLPRY